MTRRILLIEDEQLSQDIITSLLRGQGYDVDIAVDGFSALDQARKSRYDVALIDYHLPEMDGYTLGRLLGEQRPGTEPGPVLIGLTADSNGLAARRGSDAVFKAILPKPIKPAELFSTIERLCAVSRPAASSMHVASSHEPDEARRAAAALWRGHGLTSLPKAFASPPPSIEQAAALNLCFELVGAEQAQCVVLLERHGINEAVRATRRRDGAPLPIIGLSPDHADICDRVFQVDDTTSWRALAVALGAETAMATVVTLPQAPDRSAPELATAKAPAPAPQDASMPPLSATPVPTATAGAGHVAASDLRALLMTGVQTPLKALRRTFAASDPSHEEAGQLESLDAILLVTSAIADALKPPASQATDLADFDPTDLVDNAIAMIRDSRPSGAVSVSCRRAEGLQGRLCGDIHRLSQIVLTLLDDACASPDPVALTLYLDFDATHGALTLRLCHEPGVFAAGHDVMTPLRNLRLSMLSRLVALMGGTLLHKADEIWLSIPAERAVQRQAEPDIRSGAEPAPILLVDGGETSGQLVTLLLTKKGHRVCRVGDGEGALVACRDARHDLIVFDLPNGAQPRLAALASLRAFRAARADLPALVLASNVASEEEALLRELGVARTLSKPFSPEALDQAVAACRRHASEASPYPLAMIDCHVIDSHVRDALVEALGDAAVARLTGQLLDQIEALATAPEFGAEAVSRLVELAGCACVLGLADIAAHCAKPERAAVRAALHRLREVLAAPRRSAA